MKNLARKGLADRAAARVIRTARLDSKLSQEALAELAGLHRTYISLLERGQRSPTLCTLEAIAHALSITPATLLRLIAKTAAESEGTTAQSSTEQTTAEEADDASAANAD